MRIEKILRVLRSTLGNFQMYSTVLLTIVTMLDITFPKLLEVYQTLRLPSWSLLAIPLHPENNLQGTVPGSRFLLRLAVW